MLKPYSKTLSSTLTWTVVFILACLASTFCLAEDRKLEWYLDEIKKMPAASLYVEQELGDERINTHRALIPASTLKLLTAYLAIQRWGVDHRFETPFYLHQQCLWVKGLGDPMLTSEEFVAIAEQIKTKIDIDKIQCIGVDTQIFPDLNLDGRGASDNPYDAGNSALAVNFNSINVRRVNNKLVSAEPQTPLTPLAESIVVALEAQRGRKLGGRPYRLSLPGGQSQSAQYAAEVLSLILFKRSMPVKQGVLPANAQLVYQHESSKTLAQLIQAMLKYSNNYIANQLFLLMPLASEKQSGPAVMASPKLSQQYVQQQIKMKLGWGNYQVHDGAGLSRGNKISAAQLADVVKKLEPWRELFPSYRGCVFAKTGTMNDISSYAGFYLNKDRQWKVFVFIANNFADHKFRRSLVQVLGR